jgi:hypothetical protein
MMPSNRVAAVQAQVESTRTISRDGYSLTFPPEVEADAVEIERLTDLTVSELARAFPELDVPTLLKTSNLEIVLHAMPADDANAGTTTIHTYVDATGYHARLDLLAPSRFPPNSRNVLGELKDETSQHQTLVHEIGTIVWERMTMSKPTGWRLHSAPNWFVQGLEQYTAFRLVPGNSTLLKYIQRVRSHPEIVQTASGLDVTEPYLGGTALIAFLEQKYGFDGLKHLVSSSQATFDDAMRQELQVESMASLGKDFSSWLATQ